MTGVVGGVGEGTGLGVGLGSTGGVTGGVVGGVITSAARAKGERLVWMAKAKMAKVEVARIIAFFVN